MSVLQSWRDRDVTTNRLTQVQFSLSAVKPWQQNVPYPLALLIFWLFLTAHSIMTVDKASHDEDAWAAEGENKPLALWTESQNKEKQTKPVERSLYYFFVRFSFLFFVFRFFKLVWRLDFQIEDNLAVMFLNSYWNVVSFPSTCVHILWICVEGILAEDLVHCV